jgi:hypothetical protein
LLAALGVTACSDGGDGAGGGGADASMQLATGGQPAMHGSGSGGSGNSMKPPVDAGTMSMHMTDAGKSGPVIEPGDPGAVDVMVEVRTDQDMHPISPLIYGMNGGPDLDKNRFTVMRSGGNRLTAYNWENNASNAGSDYQFQNDNLLSDTDNPAAAVTGMIDDAIGAHAAALVTIPIVDYVAADKNGGGDVRNSGSDYLKTRFKQNKAAKNSAFSMMPDASDDSVYEDEFVAFLKARNDTAQILFSLDNEPDLWSSTHAEVHPDPVTYEELWDRNDRFASAIKAAWAEAEVTGFVSYGFNGYVNLQNAPDANGRDFIEWYLDQAKAAEDSGGKRLIDYLDLHWYPEAQGNGQRITGAGSDDPAVVTAREQAPRSLWDDSYEESSWIRDFLNGPIDLLHRLKDKIDAHYPGTKLAFTEWNYGGGDHISGAIAIADVLGIFGREGVGLATEWPLSDKESFIQAAYRVYRNYDGQGGTFGDVSVHATSSDVETVSVYASTDSKVDNQVVIVAINKGSDATKVGLRVAYDAELANADVYQLAGGNAEVMKGTAVKGSKSAFALMLPAQSVSVIVARP